MDPQPHPLLHFLVRMKPTNTNFFLFQVTKSWEEQGERSGLYGGCLDVTHAKSLKLIPHKIGSMGTGAIMQEDDSVRQHSRVFLLYGASQHSQPPRNEPHVSALLSLPPVPMLVEHTLQYAHLQSNKETTVWTCAFSLCMSHTLQMAVSIRNNSVTSFYEECVLWRVFDFHLTAPNI